MAINQTEKPVTKYLKENPEKLIWAEKIAVTNFQLSINTDSEEDATRIFNGLA